MSDRRQRAVDLVGYLCSRECAGRRPGSPESAAARRRIVAELEAAGIAPAGTDGYLQEVPRCGHNVLARLPGSGPLADRAVLVAAHYDHLGHASGGEAYWGADDNAAAVAILLDVGRRLAEAQGHEGRQVILAAFHGEEPPHFLSGTMGSMYYVNNPTVPIDKIDAMVCMDLVGHALGDESFPAEVRQSLFVMGAELSEGTGALVDVAAAAARGVRPRRMGLDVIPPMSDYYAFQEASVPVIFLTCGRWEHYHQTSDTPEKLDYDKIVATADFLGDLTGRLASRPEAPVVFKPDGRDDLASVESLLEVGALLEPHLPEVAVFRPQVEALHAIAQKSAFGQAERAMLQTMVMALESVLG